VGPSDGGFERERVACYVMAERGALPDADRVVVDDHVRPVIDLLFMLVRRAKVAELVKK
jgi:hypothetical protein